VCPAALVAARDWGWVMAEREGTSVVEDVRRITQETTYRELINLRDDELARRFDLLLSIGYHELTIDHYRDEIQRREIAKQNQRLEWLTGAIFLLTFVLVALEVLPRISGAGH
jgi:hypothetical protein